MPLYCQRKEKKKKIKRKEKFKSRKIDKKKKNVSVQAHYDRGALFIL